MHPSDILYRNQVKFRLWRDILLLAASSNSQLTLEPKSIEGLANFMGEQEELMKKLSSALEDMKLKIEAIEVEI